MLITKVFFRLLGAAGLVYFTASTPSLGAFDPIGALRDGVKSFLHLGGDDSLDVIQPNYHPSRGGKKLVPTKFYLVRVRCTAKIKSADLISSDLLVKSSRFVSHALWISDVPTTMDGVVPANPIKLVNVFSFDKNSAGQIVNFSNGSCSDTFLIRGTNPTLTISFAQNDTKDLTQLGNVMFGAMKLVSGLASLFMGGPLEKTIVADATGAGALQDPLKAIIGAINGTPEKAVVATPLLAGSDDPSVIETKYSRVTISVKPVNDIASQITSDDKLRSSFYSTLDGMAATYLNGVTADNLSDKCGLVAGMLGKDYTFGRKDNSFIMGYFAQSTFPANKTNRLKCIGNLRNAQDILDLDFIYNRPTGIGSFVPLDQNDVDTFFAGFVADRVLLAPGVAGPYMYGLTNRLGTLAQETDDTKTVAEKSSLTNWMGEKFTIEDLTTTFWNTAVKDGSPAVFESTLAKGFTRFGCYWLKPTVGPGAFDAVFLTFPPKSASGKDTYTLDELLAVRVALGASNKSSAHAMVTAVQVTGEPPAIYEAAHNNNDGNCGKLHITMQAAKQGDPPQPAAH